MAGSFAKGTAIGGLPVPIAVIALQQSADPCFSDLDSRNPEVLVKDGYLGEAA